MRYEFTDPNLGAIFGYTDHAQRERDGFSITDQVIWMHWNRTDRTLPLRVDGLELQLPPYSLTTTTYLQHVEHPTYEPALSSFLFNREFYCIVDHDAEVSCNGILFFGTQDLPIIRIPDDHRRKFDLLLEVILEEFRTQDDIQGEMLQMLLKRLIIICTRLAKEQLIVRSLDDQQVDVIRKFNVLVDLHYRTLRKVKDYAELLHKSPKTLSNLFAIYQQKTPQQIIQERIVLEAKRLLLFSPMQTQEIAYDLGFTDPAYFSRYFRKIAGQSPTAFRDGQV